MAEQACVVCKRTDRLLKWCADDRMRCGPCRTAWLEREHAGPVKVPPASVGEQGRFA